MTKKYINPNLQKGAFTQKKKPNEYYINGLKQGNIQVLSQAITLVESEKWEDKQQAYQIIDQFHSTQNSLRIGISGSPGVGKSSLIETLCTKNDNTKIAVLAIDPSSSISGGSILGDKTRMTLLSQNKNAFIRPSPAGKTLGGVSNATRESILLCEAAGFEYIFVETVGVGQSEIAVASMVDFFMLLVLPGSGDEIQGIKRGIMELADCVVVTKYEENRIEIAQQSMRAIKNALHLYPLKYQGWKIPVIASSAMEQYNMDELWDVIKTFGAYAQKDKWLEHHRIEQNMSWYEDQIQHRINRWFKNQSEVEETLKEHRKQLLEGRSDIMRMVNEIKLP